MAAAFLTAALLDPAFFTAFFDGGLLHRQSFAAAFFRRLLGGGSLLGGDGLLDRCLADDGLPDRLLHGGLPSRCRRCATLHCRSFRRETLCARHNRLELSARPERRNRRGLYLDGLAGARVARNAGGTAALLEDAEAGNGDAVALVDGAHDGVNDVLHGGGRLPTIGAQLVREDVDELCLVHCKTSEASGPRWTD